MGIFSANGFALTWMLPGFLTVFLFGLIPLAKGNHAHGYTLFGSKRLGDVLFLFMISLTATFPFIVIAFGVGVWKLVQS